MARDQKDQIQTTPQSDQETATTRRNFSKRAAWLAPAVLAVIAASQRPALAQSIIQPT
jgi:hypothetical protein